MNGASLEGTFGDEPIDLYVAEICGQYVKVGIAKNIERRIGVAKANNGGSDAYTKILGMWRLPRREAHAIEQVVLSQTEAHWNPSELRAAHMDRIGGWTEFRSANATGQIMKLINTLVA